MAELDRIRPGVIGAILDAISHGLGELPNVALSEMPRLADFAEWVTACEGAMDWEPGEFLAAFNENQEDAQAGIVSNDLFLTSLVEFIRKGSGPFEGTYLLLLTTLEERSNVNPLAPPTGWPRSARGCSDKIKRSIPALRAMGIGVEFLERTREGSCVRISNGGATASSPT